MEHDRFLYLFEYNYWANRRVLRAAAQLSFDELAAPGPLSHGSVRGTLVHMLSAEWIWRVRCEEQVSPRQMLNETDFPTVEALQVRWDEEEKLMRAFLAGLTNDALVQPVEYTTTKGARFSNVLWHLLTQVLNHGIQHRAEAAILLTSYGHSPGDLDFLRFIREPAG